VPFVPIRGDHDLAEIPRDLSQFLAHEWGEKDGGELVARLVAATIRPFDRRADDGPKRHNTIRNASLAPEVQKARALSDVH
jgi:hypothetical protein